MKIRPVILCGGAGTRLWPNSKNHQAKQFIDFGNWTLLGKTLERTKASIFDAPIISTNKKYLSKVKQHLRKNKISKYKIVVEPAKRNTAPAILSTALIKDIPDNQPLMFFTADHLIEKMSIFNKAINKNKSNLNLGEMLSHQSGLFPWIPFYKETLDSTTQTPRKDLYRSKQRRKHRIQIANRLHLQSSYLDSLESQIIESPLLDSLYYKYSDLPYYKFKSYVEHRYNESIDEQVSSVLIKPMRLYHTSYNPLSKVPKDLIVPSEIDTYYRNQELQGYVHDMGAAMQNGVGGHAGLFSNANDVAKIMQMYIQGGSYGGQQYLQPQTIHLFNQRYFANQNNRRGIGFDKQQFEDPGPTCLCASDRSFGHSGFTGTFAWADPDYDLVYVFLSNRTYPTMENTKLVDTNFRSEVQRVVYNALIE